MNKSFTIQHALVTTLAGLTTLTACASTTPIEPTLVSVTNEVKGIDIQMGKYEVTVEEFMRFANATGYKGPQECFMFSPDHLPSEGAGTWNHPTLIDNTYKPIVCVGTKGAMEYAKWLADTTGKPYRLPEFDEWHFAATGGNPSRFSFGDDLDHSEMCDYENIEDAANLAGMKSHHNYRYDYSANCNDGAVYHTVVGMYRPNAFGLHDMIGNVRETLQTCNMLDSKNPEQCQLYSIVGSGWHWVPRPLEIADSLPLDFAGSIEGFRLVLDSNKIEPLSKQTQSFVADLKNAQQQAQLKHNQVKLLPKKLTGVSAKLLKNNQVQLNWTASSSDDASYAIYRSYADNKGITSRKMTKIADGIKTTSYLDTLPGAGAASYQLFAINDIGEGLPSTEVFVGKHQTFSTNQRIQAELYQGYRNTYVIEKEQQHSAVFTPNKRHYPPTSALIPFEPAWQTYNFISDKSGEAKLSMNIRGEKGAEFELWQGRHLVAKVTFEGSEDFVEKTVNANLIQSKELIQIRHANKKYFILDWFELNK